MSPYNDPLLAQHNTFQTPPMGDLERQYAELKQRMDAMGQSYQQAQYPQQNAASPVWDEIDKVTAELSEAEYTFMAKNEEFIESSNRIFELAEQQKLRILKPLVEATPEGRDALDKHLTLIRRLRKTVKDEANKRDALMDEYMTKYSHLSWKDFIAMKQGRVASPQPQQQPQQQQMQLQQ